MHFRKELVVFLIAFWFACFAIGYTYAPQIGTIINPSSTVKGISTYNQSANNQQTFKPAEDIQQIDPTDLEVLTIESFAPSVNDTLSISNTFHQYLSCKNDDGNNTQISNPENISALVDKKHKLNYDYIPGDLVSIASYGIPATSPKITIRKETAEKLKEMYTAMSAYGLRISVSSGYRSFGYQQKVLNNWINMVGQANANNYSALPGYSEHHLGTTVDILTGDNGYTVSDSYFKTRTFQWLSENAFKYGFTLSYPQGKESITGYNAEGWHYRYVGIALATEVHNINTTLTEYLYAKYNICL